MGRDSGFDLHHPTGTAQENHVGRQHAFGDPVPIGGMGCQDRVCLTAELVRKLSGAARGRMRGQGLRRRKIDIGSRRLRVGPRNVGGKIGSGKDDRDPVLGQFLGRHANTAGKDHAVDGCRQLVSAFTNASSPPVEHVTLGVDGGEIATKGDVARRQCETTAVSFQRSPAGIGGFGIAAEDQQVPDIGCRPARRASTERRYRKRHVTQRSPGSEFSRVQAAFYGRIPGSANPPDRPLRRVDFACASLIPLYRSAFPWKIRAGETAPPRRHRRVSGVNPGPWCRSVSRYPGATPGRPRTPRESPPTVQC